MKVIAVFAAILALVYADDNAVDATTAAPVIQITGRYRLSSSESFDQFMQALGVGWFTRIAANAATPITTITLNGLEYDMKTETTFKTTEIKFKLGEEFDELTGDGRQCKSTITLEGSKMFHKQICDGKEYKIDREFTPTQLIMKLYAPGVVSTRTYDRF